MHPPPSPTPTGRLVEMLAAGERSSSETAARLDVVAQTTSQHLMILLNAGVVSVRRAGKQRIYALGRSSLSEVRTWLDRVTGEHM